MQRLIQTRVYAITARTYPVRRYAHTDNIHAVNNHQIRRTK